MQQQAQQQQHLQQQQQHVRDALANASTRIWCGNIASHVTSRTLKSVFASYGCVHLACLPACKVLPAHARICLSCPRCAAQLFRISLLSSKQTCRHDSPNAFLCCASEPALAQCRLSSQLRSISLAAWQCLPTEAAALAHI